MPQDTHHEREKVVEQRTWQTWQGEDSVHSNVADCRAEIDGPVRYQDLEELAGSEELRMTNPTPAPA